MTTSISSFSPERQLLIREMQRINFGRLENLTVQDGDPVLSSATRRQLEIRFGAENGPRAELDSSDFLVKKQIIELFHALDNLRDGVIDVLEIKHGLPFRMITKEVPA